MLILDIATFVPFVNEAMSLGVALDISVTCKLDINYLTKKDNLEMFSL